MLTRHIPRRSFLIPLLSVLALVITLMTASVASAAPAKNPSPYDPPPCQSITGTINASSTKYELQPGLFVTAQLQVKEDANDRNIVCQVQGATLISITGGSFNYDLWAKAQY